MNISEQLKVYFVMGSTNCINHDPEKTLAEAINGGITLFQYREKGEASLTDENRVYLGKKLRALCKRYSIPFIVNDDIELALELESDGVHLGQDDDAPLVAKKRIKNHMIIGLSTHTVEEAKLAVTAGADYIGVGPMFTTKTKTDAHEVVGPTLISHIRAAGLPDFPIVGIGGITIHNALEVYQSGANGIAVISSISHASSPREAAEAFNTLR
ncbi:thiamine phosphate synthase [Metabacillus malikii]|uniref:Thiamine-phosphate synthase n=1 Tax=Metabacillus malikii TaxID=1504265 RepID=A0ABT9ZEE3_9BACI|nr:thiamine phosphate synthase [Metabacillus malikii]MDQ0230636.1 thiamine-phosphate pyrophosphorylase [Metabacillus malikii]